MPPDLGDELAVAAAAAAGHAAPDEALAGVIPAEPATGLRLYLCAFERGEQRSWLVLDAAGEPVADRALVRDAASIVAMCEVAEESAGGGDVAELRQRLAELRRLENPEGIEEAEEAAAELEALVGALPRVADPGHLDRVGQAATRLEDALGEIGTSPFAEAMRGAMALVETFAGEVEDGYKRPLG